MMGSYATTIYLHSLDVFCTDKTSNLIAESGTDYERRLHAASCILQIFKLKGADRKHKQDRDKIHKRPFAEQEKFSPSYECTVLNDLPPDQVYIPSNASNTTISTSQNPQIPLSTASLSMGQPGASTSRSNTPNRMTPNLASNSPVTGAPQSVNAVTPLKRADSISPIFQTLSKKFSPNKTIPPGIYQPSNSSENNCMQILSRNGSPGVYTTDKDDIDTHAFICANNSSAVIGGDTGEHDISTGNSLAQITSNSTPEMVSHWLRRNRYSNHLNSFQFYNGRDILR